MKNKKISLTAMRQAGFILAQALAVTKEFIQPGKTLRQAEEFAWKQIEKLGAEPAFSRVPGYRWATCINLNAGIVHGIPDNKRFRRGDVVSLDMGVYYRGHYSDMAYSWELGSQRYRQFLAAGELALERAIQQARPGQPVRAISRAIQTTIEGGGIGSCSRDLTGHGVGRQLHQEPFIPGFVEEEMGRYRLRAGETLAIEVIYSAGRPDLRVAADGWTIFTRDGKISALFEKTVVVAEGGGQILTPYLWKEAPHGEK